MTRTPSSFLVAGLAAAVVLTGCGAQIAGAPAGGPAVTAGQSTTAPSTDVLTPRTDGSVPGPSPAPATTGEITPSDPTSTDTTPSAPVPDGDQAVEEFVSMVAEGMRSVSSYRGTISMDMGSAGSMTGSLQGTVSDGQAVDSEATIEVEAGSQSVEVRVVMIGTKVYLGGTTLLQAVPDARGKTWILADPNSSDPVVKQLATSMGSVSSNNISSMIRFATAAKSVEKGGMEEIDGVQTTQYRVVLDPEKLTDAGTGMTADSTEATFFVDGDGLMRRAVVRVGVMGQEVELTMDMTDYNTDVKIEAPAANTVYTG